MLSDLLPVCLFWQMSLFITCGNNHLTILHPEKMRHILSDLIHWPRLTLVKKRKLGDNISHFLVWNKNTGLAALTCRFVHNVIQLDTQNTKKYAYYFGKDIFWMPCPSILYVIYSKHFLFFVFFIFPTGIYYLTGYYWRIG